MRIPYVIDNIEHRLADVLDSLLRARSGQDLDVATAYFSIRGYQLLRHTLPGLRGFRLLIGDDLKHAEAVGLRPDATAYLRGELNAEPLSRETQLLVEEMIRFLRRESVQVRRYAGHDPDGDGRRRFLHAKCYLLYGSLGDAAMPADTFTPLVGIVGSSNFTGPGLTTNRELNLVHKTLLDADEIEDSEARREVAWFAQDSGETGVSPADQRLLKSEVGARAILDLARWYNAQWAQAVDYKDALIEMLENSKFGGREYTPYEIYMKALYEYFRDDLDAGALDGVVTRSAVELAEFQEDAVKKAQRILARYDGVIIGDSVGLGKTWIGKRLLEDRAYHLRQKALVVCPASLRKMWESELSSAAIAASVLTQEQLGQAEFDLHSYLDVDVILVDEAHNFRNHRAQRYQNLEFLIAGNKRRGRGGERKKVILLTATPINNGIFDLYNQINLFTGGDRGYFASAGIGDLYRYFLSARQKSIEEGSIQIFNLLEEVVIRRTRQFIQRAYPEATIRGKRITWPERRLQTVEYDLEATYEGFYSKIVGHIDGLCLPHYYLESYKKKGQPQDEFELGRQGALVGIFKSRFLKRLESSIEAFSISIRRALEFAKTFAEYISDGIVLDSSAFREAMALLASEDEDSDDLPASRAEEIDAHVEAQQMLESLPRLNPEAYDRRRLHRDLNTDIDALTEVWHTVQNIRRGQDAKLERLKTLLGTGLRGQKVLIFTYYKDTARYLHRTLIADETWLAEAGHPHIRRVDSSVRTADRLHLVEAFAPDSSGQPHLKGTSQEIDVLIATDVMSEGQNLQDCGALINFDLHWNPTRMVQRAGRIDRLGSSFPTLTIYNLFPQAELEALLGLVQSLTSKIDVINQAGFLDASVLGEVVTPREFNTLRRIAAEDNTVIEEQESYLELVSSEALFTQLQRLLETEARQWIANLDDGIHSGIQRARMRGVFMYFTAPHAAGQGRQHFWRYYDVASREITDNRYQIMQLIACVPDTPRFPPPYDQVDIYAVQEQVIAHILQSVALQQSIASAPKPVEAAQVTVAELLREHIDDPQTSREEVRELRKFLKQPFPGAYVKRLRGGLQDFKASGNILDVLNVVRALQAAYGAVETPAPAVPALARDDLHLVCYEYVWG